MGPCSSGAAVCFARRCSGFNLTDLDVHARQWGTGFIKPPTEPVPVTRANGCRVLVVALAASDSIKKSQHAIARFKKHRPQACMYLT